MEWQDFDLLGDVVDPNKGERGRPAHRPTPENANKYMLLAAEGYKDEEIAKALGISLPTLRKYYFSKRSKTQINLKLDRKAARLRVKALQLHNLEREAANGNAGAAEKLLKRIDAIEARERAEALAAEIVAERSENPPVGKKEAAHRAAEEVSGIFAPPSGPESVH